jgi:hypothetical protein
VVEAQGRFDVARAEIDQACDEHGQQP